MLQLVRSAPKSLSRASATRSLISRQFSASALCRNEVDDRVKYPAPGTYTPSVTEPNPATGRPVPLNVDLNNYEPFRHPQTHGHHVCSLQLRSFFTPDLDFFCNFVLRVAFYLRIPASGVTPLPRKTERWTVIKSPFVHAKVKENFERRTHKRQIKLYDANPEVIQLFLATVRKYCIAGVGMKASVFHREGVDVVESMESIGAAEKDQFEGIASNADPKVAEAIRAILDDPVFQDAMKDTNTEAPKQDE